MSDIESELSRTGSVRVLQDGVIRDIDLDEVPEEIRGQLAALFDKDGDGKISPGELNDVASAYAGMKQQLLLFRRGLVALGAMNLLWFVAMCGVTFAIVAGSKDTAVHGRSLYSKTNEPLAMNVNTIKAPLGSYAFMPEDKATSIADILIRGNNGERHYRKMKSADIVPYKAITLTTLDGDKIVWDHAMSEGKDILVTLADGTEMTRPAGCEECTAASVVVDEEVVDALEEFLEAIDLKGGRRLEDCGDGALNEVISNEEKNTSADGPDRF
mmetsp:Transcript_41383/g.88196  ORF Transcript_41383/g.88196 Transcript_41383/m.88196 type:complete len:271 (-) Transcript_41383:283-1095(-)|eukprot:CAMPEP_0172550828 /NCGR_PEP_ID=MMETSP1067-20121228/33360_1 /TAXON_ID=265564 ORGANISM="Thalassiosira punctigera, Strain Tpunct2005C2" /NCGR_SAMPLE_ID=MMETSP1067 /ASSEMBLY_ACC=CAM_ASM_000444 /LENGTH=270 /DNA_ID=CAMNT_0013338505 /DNA_START=5 /DNA_END=817 /DNA_ORIENTATION=-